MAAILQLGIIRAKDKQTIKVAISTATYARCYCGSPESGPFGAMRLPPSRRLSRRRFRREPLDLKNQSARRRRVPVSRQQPRIMDTNLEALFRERLEFPGESSGFGSGLDTLHSPTLLWHAWPSASSWLVDFSSGAMARKTLWRRRGAFA